jgi:pantoate--beta-alanine ligase
VLVKELVDRGERSAPKLIAAARDEIAKESAARLDYFEIVNPDTLDPVEDISRGALAAMAAYFGATRLIDNALLPASNG